jgi:hypothetical protein
MLEYFVDCNSRIDVPIEHCTYQVNAIVAHHVGDSEIPVHDLIDTVKRILFVDDSVEKYAEGPDILLFAPVRLPSQDLRCCVI